MISVKEEKRKLAGLLAKADALLAKDTDETPMTDEDSASYADLMAQVQALSQRIERIEDRNSVESDSAKDDNDDDLDDDDSDFDDDTDKRARKAAHKRAIKSGHRERVFATAKKSPVRNEKGDKAARMLMGIYHSKNMGAERTADWIENRFGDSDVAKALASTVDGPSGGDLIPTAFSTDWIELLLPLVAVRKNKPELIGMPAGNLTIPRLAGGATATYGTETTPAATSQQTFDQLILSNKKLTAMVPVTNDLLRKSPIGVEGLITANVVQMLGLREDLAFLRGDGTNSTPTGLLNMCLPANVLTAAGVDAVSVTNLMNGLVQTLETGNSRMIRPAWIFNPAVRWFLASVKDQVGGFLYKDELLTGSFNGIPYVLSNQIPNNVANYLTASTGTAGSEIYLADYADLIIASTYEVGVEVSNVASYVDGTGATVNSFQSDQTVFRVMTENDFGCRHLASVAVGKVNSWINA